jgi:hypothetical protein
MVNSGMPTEVVRAAMGSQLWYSVTDYDVWLQKVCEVEGARSSPTSTSLEFCQLFVVLSIGYLVWLISSTKRAKSKGATFNQRAILPAIRCAEHRLTDELFVRFVQ